MWPLLCFDRNVCTFSRCTFNQSAPVAASQRRCSHCGKPPQPWTDSCVLSSWYIRLASATSMKAHENSETGVGASVAIPASVCAAARVRAKARTAARIMRSV